MGRIRIRNFEYSNIFHLFDSIRNSRIRSYISEYRSNIFLHVKLALGDLLFSDLTIKQITTAKLLLTYM